MPHPKLPEESSRRYQIDKLAEPKLPEEGSRPDGSEGWRPRTADAQVGRLVIERTLRVA